MLRPAQWFEKFDPIIDGAFEQAGALGFSIGLTWIGFCAQVENR
jgi:hypothetical protein